MSQPKFQAFDPYAIKHVIKAVAEQIGDSFLIDSCDYKYDLKAPYADGWTIDEESLLHELFSRIFPLPGLSQHEEPTPEELNELTGDDRLDVHLRQFMNFTGWQFVYEPGLLRAKVR